MNSANKKDYDNMANAYINMYAETAGMKPKDQDDDAENSAEIIAAADEIEAEGGKVPPEVKKAEMASKKNLKAHIKRTL
jgi:hypothetical protein